MTLSAYFIYRPVATTLLTLAVTLAGLIAFFHLPVAPLPQVDFPTISVQASLPGASPETMSTSVATPLERSLAHIAGITEMTSASSIGTTSIILQFDLGRDIDGAARDVQAAINAASNLLPGNMPSRPSYRKVNPADSPIMILALTSETMTRGQLYDAASTILAQKISQIQGIGQVTVGGSSLPAVRIELNPAALAKYGIGFEEVRAAIDAANANQPKGALEDTKHHWHIYANDQAKTASDYMPLIISYRNGAAVRLSDLGRRHRFRGRLKVPWSQGWQTVGNIDAEQTVRRQHHRNSRQNKITVTATTGIHSEAQSIFRWSWIDQKPSAPLFMKLNAVF